MADSSRGGELKWSSNLIRGICLGCFAVVIGLQFYTGMSHTLTYDRVDLLTSVQWWLYLSSVVVYICSVVITRGRSVAIELLTLPIGFILLVTTAFSGLGSGWP